MVCLPHAHHSRRRVETYGTCRTFRERPSTTTLASTNWPIVHEFRISQQPCTRSLSNELYMVAAFFRLPFRPSPLRREALRSLRSTSHFDAHRVSTVRSVHTDTEQIAAPMLRKGDNKYGAEAAIAANTLQAQAKANPSLRKTLFPSSSPTGPPPSQDGNIRNVFQRMSTAKPGSQTSSGPRNPASGMDALKPVTPLASASGNAQANPGPRFQSICTATADPFKDEVHGKAWNSENFPSVDQDLAWLEQNMDDDFDDLDFDSPPTAQKPSPPLPPAAPAEKRNAMLSSQATGVSWSSSPPQHMQPPSITRADSAASNTSSSSLKRKPLDDNPSKPAPKRRGLPFTSSVKCQDVSDAQAAIPPPAPAKRYDPLEASASAIKEQRKSHKLQRTQSGGPELNEPRSKPMDLSHSETRGIVSSPAKAVPQIFLSTEQKHVLDLVTKKGESVFFTGPAGTGKSVLMRAIISELKKKWAKDPEKLAVTASTGLAACNIGGITLHSFSGKNRHLFHPRSANNASIRVY